MKEEHFCRCCLSEECYKDMTSQYYIGNKTENYLEMLLNIFNINIIKDDAERCFICEECVSKLREAAAFKKKVLDVQKILKSDVNWDNIDKKYTTLEDVKEPDNFNDFDDNVNDNDFLKDNFTQDGSQKEQVFVITLESGNTQDVQKTISKFNQTQFYEKRIKQAKNTASNSSIGDSQEKGEDIYPSITGQKERVEVKKLVKKDSANIRNPLNTNENDTNDKNTEGLNYKRDCQIAGPSKRTTKRSSHKRIVKTETDTAKQKKDTVNKTKANQREVSQIELRLKHKSENTLKLIQNSNLCLFRSLRNKFGCCYCQLKFPEFCQLREHSLSHKNPKMLAIKRLRGLSCKNAEISDLKCNLCSEECTELQELTVHLKNKHEISFRGTEHYLVPYKLKDGVRCVLCELKFNTFLRLSIHMNSHYTNNVCEICGLSFINRISLRTHFQSQHKEKKCSRCPAIFMKNSLRSKHLWQVHGLKNTKRYCNLCSKTFKYTYMLEEHKIQEHGVKRQISSCMICGKTFMSPLNLKTHMRSVHIRERNYPCTKCGMRFFTKCDQRRHERTHEDVRSFSCSYCDAKFKSKDSWRRHLKRQHGHVFGETT